MREPIGYVGKYRGFRICFNGEFYYAEIKGKNYVVDENKINNELERK